MNIKKLPIEHLDPLALLGRNDVNLRQIEREVPVRITLRDGTITVSGDEEAVGTASRALKELVELAERGKVVEEADVATALGRKNGQAARLADAYEGAPGFAFDRKTVRARTPRQAEYLKAMDEHEIVFSIGPAGTGKTYLAVAAAANALRQKKADRIILVRPAVEAGESLGFLPGDMQEKVDPYLRPMYDALADMMSYDRMRRYIELGVIEIAPLAFMRGRTLHNSFVIMDEAQNTTVRQMKMFLTRLGVNSRAVITGDITQIDLKDPDHSGLVRIQSILGSLADIKFIYFHPEDVVRHRLVRDIIRAFDAYHARQNGKQEDGVGTSLDPEAETEAVPESESTEPGPGPVEGAH
ncbi:MAG: PhoH family protein [Candidatus Eisenbacteria bacterium]|uniref:PhoH-like protein n=1 Tax=Eiseniibacteriota bacterium TaxID=2212470 RepID=A0A538U927_UNCEI|nr:MAG: PhoH family protein [Candidatus Eisenbacteria bacterium]